MLGPLILAGHNDSTRDVRDPDSGIGDINVLATRSGRAVGINPEVLILYFDFDVLVNLRIYEYRGKAGFPARSGIERAKPDQPVDAGFGGQEPVGVLALHRESRRLDPGFLAWLFIDDLCLEPSAFAPSEVHSKKHFGPVLRVGSTGPGIDSNDCVTAIVRT